MKFEEYKKYRWFITSSKKTVIGGRSAEQNDSLLSELKSEKKDFWTLHTSAPGSPFAVILADIKEVTEEDLQQAAVFTASFSKAWKEGKKKALVDIFKLSQVYKAEKMKSGTWGVKGPIHRISVFLELVLTKQKGVLRAVPSSAVSEKQVIIKLVPGKIDKQAIVPKLALELNQNFKQEELLSALPAGGIKPIRK